MTNGLYLELVCKDMVPPGFRCPLAHEVVLQVMDRRTYVRPGESDSCVYVLKEAAMRLLHIPSHIFDVLSAHRHGHHCDRSFATHVVAYKREKRAHLLVNAHPGAKLGAGLALDVSIFPTEAPLHAACMSYSCPACRVRV